MRRLFAMAALAGLFGVAHADEGMWTFDNFPSERVRKAHGFAPDKEWLDHVRLSSVRLAGGCSGSIVSSSGLVMTNHHCSRSCIQQLSTPEKDLMTDGYFAATQNDELRCPEIELNQLVGISDVTDKVTEATKGKSGAQFTDAQKAEMSRIEKGCATTDTVRCDVVTLYNGGRYHLYKYKRFQDVRLVFAPEAEIAHFGGDPDNFMFPRYSLDVSFLRIYEGGAPVKTDEYLSWSPTGPKEGDLAFVSGHPGGTSRLFTTAQLEYERDVALPERLLWLARERGMLGEFQHRSAESRRISTSALLGVENSYKGGLGRLQALLDKSFFAGRVAAEKEFRGKIEADHAKRAAYGDAFDAIAQAKRRERELRKPYSLVEQQRGFASTLMAHARTLVRAAAELPKPNEERLREYADSRLPALKQRLFSKAPIYDELEVLNLTFALSRLREELGPDDPLVRKVLGRESPEDLAATLVKGTGLRDTAARKELFDGGQSAVNGSTDPMIALMRMIDPDARAIRKTYEDEVESVLKKNGELLAKARFELYGTGAYPDATFTLRLSYGTVKGFETDGRKVAPLTRFAGLFDRDTGKVPFSLPESWLSARSGLNLETPMNFCTDNDIIGGNSGSPVIDKEGRVSGLIFDGNIYSLGGDYGFDESVNRAVAVHSAALLEALKKVYGAKRIVDEIMPH